MNNDLKTIKKIYGEKMMHFCRDFFSSILEEQGLLPKLLQENFAESHFLYADLEENNLLSEFKNYIYDLFYRKDEEIEIIDIPTPQELMKKAGYLLFECKTEEDIQNFRKYYAKGEELCTFHGGRLNACHVFFAVKENVDEINRVDFSNPERQDEYGTSVISIQFSKDESHTLSIKNRYNHHVVNPDATFGNNLDNIIEGLTESFEETYGLKQNHKNNGFEIPGYVRANDGRWYKYNIEIDNIYFCPDNIIIDNGEVKRYDKEKYIIMDYFILDIVNKRVNSGTNYLFESFPSLIGKIKRITIIKKGEEKEITIINNNDMEIIVTINKYNQICSLKSNDIKQIGEHFLAMNEALETLDLPFAQRVGSNFLSYNKKLKSINMSELQEVGHNFLFNNEELTEIYFPKLRKVLSAFISENIILKRIDLPELQSAGRSFLFSNNSLISLSLPSLQEVGDNFLIGNKSLIELELPLLQKTGRNFLGNNRSLIKLDLPQLEEAGAYFLLSHPALREKFLSKLQSNQEPKR